MAITEKICREELLFLCAALFFNQIYPPMKFHDNISKAF
jgi:hypothetical protein